VTLNGSTHYYTGPAAPVFLAGNSSRTVEAWIFNPAVNTEETVFAWGRRGGPDGSNASFIHGTDPTFGAMGHWGAPDVGWNGISNLVQGQWTFVAYTYDGVSQTATVYKDGAVANTRVLAAPLNTWAVDTTPAARPLPFMVGAQNNADGSPGGQFASLTIAKVRVYDQALSGQAIGDQYSSERGQFAPAQGLRLGSVAVNRQTGAVTIGWTAVAGQTYTVEASTNLIDWSPLATSLTSGTFTETPAAPYKFYRLRVQ
jgi:hypothetical protein